LRYSRQLASVVFLITAGASVAGADTMAYGMTTLGFEWGTLDLNTGVYSSVGPTYFASTSLGGVGVENGRYYAAGWTSSQAEFGTFNSLLQIDPSSGSVVLGTYQSLPLYQFDSAPGKLGSNANSLYFLINNPISPLKLTAENELFSVNGSNGQATSIGQPNLPASASVYALSVSTDSPSLYALVANTSVTPDLVLYGIDPTTGAVTLIGDTSIAVPSSSAALLFENGTLWATVDSVEYTLNPTTGSDTFLANLTLPQFYSLTDTIGGLAPDVSSSTPPPASAPEPSTWSIILLGAGSVAIFFRRRCAMS
jgi:PEP-CTERM motif